MSALSIETFLTYPGILKFGVP